MRQKIIITIFWMVIFAAVNFWFIPFVFTVLTLSGVRSYAWFEYVLWPLRLIFVLSPFVALLLGWRGLLPGTRPADFREGGVNTVSRILALVVILIIALFTAGAWIALMPPPGRPHISITLLGYTNDAAGNRLAQITVLPI